MPTISITCPGCDKRLRLNKRPETGKKIKCPACTEVFVPALDDDEAEATAIQEKPSQKARAAAVLRNRADDDDAPVRRRRGTDDDDDDHDDNDRAERKRRNEDDERPSRKKKRKQKPGSRTLLYALLGAGACVLMVTCGGLGVTAFVWPGFMLTKTKAGAAAAAGNAEQLKPVNLNGFVLADADLVAGVNAKSLRDVNQLDGFLNGFKTGVRDGLPRGFDEIARDCDRMLVSVNVAEALAKGGGFNGFGPPGQPPNNPNAPKGGPGVNRPAAAPKLIVALALSSREATDRVKNVIRTTPGMGGEEKLAGKYPAFRYRDQANGEVTIFAFPSDRVLVITPSSEQVLTALLARAEQSERPATELGKLAALVEPSGTWAAYRPDATARTFLGTLPLFLGNAKDMPVAIQGAVQALGKVKGISIGMDSLADGGGKLRLHVALDDADAARRLKEGGEALKTMVVTKLARDPTAPDSAKQDVASVSMAVQGTTVSATMTVSAQTFARMKANVPGMVGAGPPNQAPPPNRPQGGPPRGRK